MYFLEGMGPTKLLVFFGGTTFQGGILRGAL